MDQTTEEPLVKEASPTDSRRERIFHNAVKWTELEGQHPLAVIGNSPFLYKSDPSSHILQIHSLDLDLEDNIPNDINFDSSQLAGLPQTPICIHIKLQGTLTSNLEPWPNFSLQQSLANGEPPGYPGINKLSPWEDERMGWFRVWQDGQKLASNDKLVAGEITFECCCIGMLDDPSQGGFRGRYIFEFDAFTGEEGLGKTFTSLKAELCIRDPGEEWGVEV